MKRMRTSAGVGLVLGVAAAAITGQWWLVGVGLVLGAGLSSARRG